MNAEMPMKTGAKTTPHRERLRKRQAEMKLRMEKLAARQPETIKLPKLLIQRPRLAGALVIPSKVY